MAWSPNVPSPALPSSVSIIAISGGKPVLDLYRFMAKKVDGYMLMHSRLIFAAANNDVVIPGVGSFYCRGIETFIITEMVEALVNIVCYNVIIRSRNNEVSTLISSIANFDLFISVLRVNYQTDRRKLVDMLINNETNVLYRDAKTVSYADDQALSDYIDTFNGSVLRELYMAIRFIVEYAAKNLAALIFNLYDEIGQHVEQLFLDLVLPPVIHPSSVFVNYRTYDIVVATSPAI
jgi:hypothetical protein